MWDRVLAWVLARVMAELSDRPARQLECHARFGHDGPGVIALGTQARYTNKKGEPKNFRKISGRANGQHLAAPTIKTEGAPHVQTSGGGHCRTEYFRRRGFGAGGESRRGSALYGNWRRIRPPNGSRHGALST